MNNKPFHRFGGLLLVCAALAFIACQNQGSSAAASASPTASTEASASPVESASPAVVETAPSATPAESPSPSPVASASASPAATKAKATSTAASPASSKPSPSASAAPSPAPSPSPSPVASPSPSPSPTPPPSPSAPAVPSWKVSYLGNGSTSGAAPADPARYEEGMAITVAAPGTLQRVHYTFNSWNTAADGSGTKLAPGASLTMGTAAINLYAMWDLKPNYGVKYASTLQTGGAVPNDDKRYETGDAVRLSDNTGKLVRTGYSFAGWASQADGHGQRQAAGSTITMASEDITYYARWVLDTVAVPAGTYQRSPAKADQSTVSAFRIGRFEVTQQQYQDATGQSPASFNTEIKNPPMDRASWYHALVFCNYQSKVEELSPVYSINGSTDPAAWGKIPTADTPAWNSVKADWNASGYRLPTEAEWQWAAQGAKDKDNKDFAGSDGTNSASDYAWFKDNSGGATHPIGTLKPNELGLYDMCGNVAEWCWDWFAEMKDGPQTDFKGPATGKYRILRGGSWNYNAATIMTSYRNSYNQNFRDNNIGFRVVRK